MRLICKKKMEIDQRSMSELEETRILTQTEDMGVAFELEVTAESQVSNISGSKHEEEEEAPKAVTECAKAEKSRDDVVRDAPEKEVQKMDEVDEALETTDARSEETRKRSGEEEVWPVLQRIPSEQPSCGSDVIRITKDQFKIGRKMDNDEVIVSVYISRNHCTVQRDVETGNWTVTNLSSTDTFLNDTRIKQNDIKLLKHGDILQLSSSDGFRYKFMLVNKKPEPSKCPRLESTDNQLGDVLSRQKSFVEWQKNERKDLEKQLTDKQQEQEQLKEELDKLLEDQKYTKEANEELNNQIVELREKIEIGNTTEMELQQKYRELLGKLEEERLKFEEKLAEEKQKWQEELKESKQEKEKLKMTYVEQMEEMKEQLVKKQQEEWQKKIDSVLQEEKSVQTKLQSEKQLLEQRLKAMEEDIKKKEQAAKVQEQIQKNLEELQKQRQAQLQQQFQEQLQQQLQKQQQHLQQLKQQQLQQQQLQQLQQKLIPMQHQGKCILVEVKRGDQNIQRAQLLETIDLTKAPDSPSTSSMKNGQDKAVIDKVNNIMDEQLTCSICSELFIRAMTLNCMHTFCRHCIESWSKRRRECPNCRAVIVSMTRSLVVDNFIEKMLESFTPEQMQKRKQLVEERQRLSKVQETQRKAHRRR